MYYLISMLFFAGFCKANFTQTPINLHLNSSGNSFPLENSVLNSELDETFYQKVFNFTKDFNAYKHLTYEEMKFKMTSLNKWEAPSKIKETFPYYLAGYDFERRPVWIAEIGKLDFRALIEPGEESVATGKRYLFKAMFNIIKSFIAMDSGGVEVRKAVIIFDMEGSNFRQLNYLPSWAIFAELFAQYWDLVFKLIGNVLIINANYVTKLAIDIARPVVGQLMENIETYGSDKNKYLRRLRQLMPADIIPPWYGGSSDFKPISVHG